MKIFSTYIRNRILMILLKIPQFTIHLFLVKTTKYLVKIMHFHTILQLNLVFILTISQKKKSILPILNILRLLQKNN